MSNGHTPIPPGVAPDVAHERGYVAIQSERQIDAYTNTLTERQRQIPGLLIPIYRLGASVPYTWVLRPDRPRIGNDGTAIKYEWPQGVPLCLDVLSCYQAALSDPSIEIWFTEGAKKADALASAYGKEIVPISLNGVWGWMRRGHDGASHPLDDLDSITWTGRKVVLAFDSDVTRKIEVQRALKALARNLRSRGALVRVLVLPQDDAKVGVDDALAAGMSPIVMRAYIRGIEDLPPPIESGLRRYLTEDEIDTLRPPTWLIKATIPAGEVTMISGAGDAGKTFIVVDMMKRVAQHYPTMYVAAEDAPGIRIRKRAWELHHKTPKNGKFLMWTAAIDLFDAASVDSFIAEVEPLGLRMITFDTLSRCLGGADENSNTDMAIVMSNCERIAHATGAAVVLIHHTTKDGVAFRGASALRNNTYGHLEVSRDDELIQFKVGRIKNTKEAPARYFKLVDVPIADILDEEGNAVSSAVILPSEHVAQGDKLRGNEIKMLAALQDMTDATDGASVTMLQKSLETMSTASFYRALKRLKEMHLASKGEKTSDPWTITPNGRLKLAKESTDPQYQTPGSSTVGALTFEVNPHLANLLSNSHDSNQGDSNPDSGPKTGTLTETTISGNSASQSPTITTIKQLSPLSDSSGQTTIYHSHSLKGESSDSSPESESKTDEAKAPSLVLTPIDQEVPEGTTVPVGATSTIDLASGKRYARLPDVPPAVIQAPDFASALEAADRIKVFGTSDKRLYDTALNSLRRKRPDIAMTCLVDIEHAMPQAVIVHLVGRLGQVVIA